MPSKATDLLARPTLLNQTRTLVRDCRVELASLGIAVALTALLGESFPVLRQWDATGVVVFVGFLWMVVCVGLYQLLLRTTR
jgi:hypothetical protein